MKNDDKIKILIILEIIEVFNKFGLLGAKHFTEEIESLVRIIKNSHDSTE